MKIRITERDLEQIREQLDSAGKATHVFEFSYRDREGVEVARVRNTIFLRRKATER